jgi:hypothetical protein
VGVIAVGLTVGCVSLYSSTSEADEWCEVGMPASYVVWACSPEAEFIKGRFVWVHWDVDELRTVLQETLDN